MNDVESPRRELGAGAPINDFFISYNQHDLQWAEWIAWNLEAAKYTLFFDPWHSRAGDNFVKKMDEAITNARQTILVLSENYLRSEYPQAEWTAVFAGDPVAKAKKLIPIRVAACQPSGLLQALVRIDLVGLGEEDALATLLEGLRPNGKPATRPQFPAPPAKGGVAQPRARRAFPGTESDDVTVWREKHAFLQTQASNADTQALKRILEKQLEAVQLKLEMLTGAPQTTRDPSPAKGTRRRQPSQSRTRGTRRFLRRRCRVMPSEEGPFRETIRGMLSHQLSQDRATTEFERIWLTLPRGYEQEMAHAAYLESLGEIEEMCKVLGDCRFADATRDNARRLYLALGCEKLDDLNTAKAILHQILESEKAHDLIRAAQFNLQVCYEKEGAANADFSRFIGEVDVTLIDSERLHDKALAMQLIVAIKERRPYPYRPALEESLAFLQAVSKTGYAKTLLTQKEYEAAAPLTAEVIETILEQTDFIDLNSQVAILVTLLKYLPPDYIRRTEVIDRLVALTGRSATVAKWLRSTRSSVRPPTPR